VCDGNGDFRALCIAGDDIVADANQLAVLECAKRTAGGCALNQFVNELLQASGVHGEEAEVLLTVGQLPVKINDGIDVVLSKPAYSDLRSVQEQNVIVGLLSCVAVSH
jgi:hypothetical protein